MTLAVLLSITLIILNITETIHNEVKLEVSRSTALIRLNITETIHDEVTLEVLQSTALNITEKKSMMK